jgi:endonuclease/exonuclease/phosphatase family metal-dependent hydrolase
VLVGSFVPFRSKSISNSLIDRGFLYAQIKIGEKIVHTITTHLNPSESHYGILSPEEYRRRQLAEILEFKKSVGHDHDTWVIGGDFNDCSTVRSLEPMMSVSLDQSPCATSHDRVPYAINCEGVHECIDYITTNRPQRYSRILQNLISDHYGVEVAVAL